MTDAMTQDAEMLIEDFVQLQRSETIAIFTDHTRAAEADALAAAARQAGGVTIVVDIDAQVAELLESDEFYIPPPAHVQAAMIASNVSIFTVDETYVFRLDHKLYQITEATPERSYFSVDPGMGSWNFTRAERESVEADGTKILEAMKGADKVHVTTEKGTDLHLSISGRECLYVRPVPWRGLTSVYPIPLWGELNWAPIEDYTHGTAVIDGLSEATNVLKDVAEPVTFTIEGGRIIAVAGGVDADEFRELIQIDDGAPVIGELGIGANPKAMLATQSEKALAGAIHLGLGENKLYPGGLNRSKIHVDAGLREATIEVDGRLIMDRGTVVI